MRNEDLAREVGNNRKRLLQRLNEAKSCLVKPYLKGFGKGVFDFDAKTLTGDNGVVLLWKLRENPESPESYQNQQTSRGHVQVLIRKRATG